MELIEHFCDFEKYCNKCVHKEKKEIDSPCDECLDTPVNEYTDRPVHFSKIEP